MNLLASAMLRILSISALILLSPGRPAAVINCLPAPPVSDFGKFGDKQFVGRDVYVCAGALQWR